MEDISQIVAAISSFVGFFGMVGTIVSWALAIGFVVLAIMGLVRPAFRFGKGIAWKKVFIVADGETGKEIQCDLERSGLIKPKNILTKTKGQTGDLNYARLVILDYEYLGNDDVLRIVSNKNPDCGILVYAKPGIIIGPRDMATLNLFQHVSIVNMRGRLVNETLLLMLSTSFTKKDAQRQAC